MKKSSAKAIALIAAISAILIMEAGPIFSQVFAMVSGTVKSKDGQPIAGAKVVMILSEDGSKVELTTDSKGKWRKANVKAGDWTIGFMADGYDPQNITVSLSAIKENRPIDIRLSPIPVSPLKTGDDLYQQQKYTEALQDYEKALAQNPELYEAYEKIGLCHLRLNDTEKAIENLKLALEHNPQSQDVLINLSAVYLEKGDLEEGMRYFKLLDEKSLKDPSLFFNIGVLLFKGNQVDLAAEYLKKGLELDPNSVNGHYQLGLVSLNKGDLDEARSSFQKVIELAPCSEKAELAKKMLEGIK